MHFPVNGRIISFGISVAIIFLFAVNPVFAFYNGTYYVVAPNIHQGATVFIGEQGLNVSPALASAGTGTKIGWWASMTNPDISPYSQFFDFGPTGANSFTVNNNIFVGYTGNWYMVNPGTSFWQGPDSVVFNVQDPTLSINIWDWDRNEDVTSRSVLQGDTLGFRISTNMIDVLDGILPGSNRTPVYGYGGNLTSPDGDGYINIRVKDEQGVALTGLYNASGAPQPLSSLNVSVSPYFWGNVSGSVITAGTPGNWSTGVLNETGQQVYSAGTYVVTAESLLNNMKNNYKNGGVFYTGKTVSQAVTISIVRNILKPVATFEASPTSGVVPLTVIFTDISANRPTAWAWTFGDGNTTDATVQNPVHTYLTPGRYTVSLNATNINGFNSTTNIGLITVTNTTVSKMGVFRPSTHMFYPDYNENGSWDGAAIDRAYNFGLTGDSPVSGKWT